MGFSRFDYLVWGVLALLVGLVTAFILTGNRANQSSSLHPAILFIRPDNEGPDQLFIADPAGNIPTRQLTQVTTDILDFSPAPDGTQIAYTALVSQTAAADIWLMNDNGRGQRKLLACPDAACTRPVWHPDGRRLIYERRSIPTPGAPPGNPRLWWLDVTTGETVPVFQDSQLLGLFAAISPDGRWLSFVSPLDQGIQLYNLESGASTLIPNRMGTAAAWSPDSSKVALADILMSGQDWSVTLATVDVNSGSAITLSQTMGDGMGVDDSNPVWAPDGTRLAFGRKEARTAMGRQLWLMDADGTAATPLTGETEIHHGNHSWSPDGRNLLYQRYNLKELYSRPAVWIIDTTTGQSREIAYPASQPAWLP
jgi:Tol biopolymer transport system component